MDTLAPAPIAQPGPRSTWVRAQAPDTAEAATGPRPRGHNAGRLALLGQLAASSGCAHEAPKEHEDMGYVLAVGIDRLGFYNETLGTAVADGIIAATGERLRDILGAAAIVHRVGGDVFGVLMRSAPSSEMPAVAAHILSSFRDVPLRVDGQCVRVGVSIGGAARGAAQGPNGAIDPALLISRAESALRTAKDAGRGRFVAYAQAACQTATYARTMATGNAFLAALQGQRLGLAFQQVVDARTGRVAFHEALIRMVEEDGTVRRAADFIPAVEELGLVRMLDQAAIQMVIRELTMFPDLRLSANVSHDSLTDMTWLRGVVAALRDRPDVARRLIVEITESAVMRDLAQTDRIVKTLKDLGCRVALDDFGAGHTAFSQIQALKVDIVKIDQSFIRRMHQDNNHLFIRALQALADGINIETVGEGAETAEEARILTADGVHHIQGYVHGVPAMERLWLPAGHVHRRFGRAQ